MSLDDLHQLNTQLLLQIQSKCFFHWLLRTFLVFSRRTKTPRRPSSAPSCPAVLDLDRSFLFRFCFSYLNSSRCVFCPVVFALCSSSNLCYWFSLSLFVCLCIRCSCVWINTLIPFVSLSVSSEVFEELTVAVQEKDSLASELHVRHIAIEQLFKNCAKLPWLNISRAGGVKASSPGGGPVEWAARLMDRQKKKLSCTARHFYDTTVTSSSASERREGSTWPPCSWLQWWCDDGLTEVCSLKQVAGLACDLNSAPLM